MLISAAVLLCAAAWLLFRGLAVLVRPARRRLIPAPVPLPAYNGRHRATPIGD